MSGRHHRKRPGSPRLGGLLCLLGLAVAAALPADTPAQAFPERDLTLVLPFGPGGATDAVFRLLAGPAGEALGQPIEVENEAGAAATRGAQRVREAAPDGYTLLGSHQTLILSQLSGMARYDHEAFEAVALLTRTINIPATRAGHPVRRAADIADHVRAAEAPVRIGLIKGSTDHFFWLRFLERAGIDRDAVQLVGYPDTAAQVAALVGEEIDFSMLNLPSARELFAQGVLRPLGVADDERLAGLPDTPTLREQGIDMVNSTNRGLFAPAGTSPERLAIVAEAFATALADPALVRQLEVAHGTRVDLRIGEDYRDHLERHSAALTSLAQELGFAE